MYREIGILLKGLGVKVEPLHSGQEAAAVVSSNCIKVKLWHCPIKEDPKNASNQYSKIRD